MNLTLARARTWPLASLPLRAMAAAARASCGSPELREGRRNIPAPSSGQRAV
jgi:hypothetical protein